MAFCRNKTSITSSCCLRLTIIENFGDRLSNVLLHGACVVELRCFIMIILIFFVFQLL